jgi:hypothetical protein
MEVKEVEVYMGCIWLMKCKRNKILIFKNQIKVQIKALLHSVYVQIVQVKFKRNSLFAKNSKEFFVAAVLNKKKMIIIL